MQSQTVQGELKALAASADLRAVVDNIKDYAIFLLDLEGTVLTWNPGAERIKGYAPADVIGTSFTRFYTEDDRTAGRPHRLLAEARQHGRAESEGWRVRKDGTRFWADVVVSPLAGPGGEVTGFVKVTRDLTSRRAAEEALRQSEERLRLMIEAVRDYAIFMLDPQGRVTTWNSGAQRLKGYKPAEIVGQHFSRFYSAEDVEAGKPARELQIASSVDRFEEEGWRLRKDGSRFWANVVLTAVRNEQGVLLGFVKVTRDLTDRKRTTEEMLERARQQAAVAELGLFAVQTPQIGALKEHAVRTVSEVLGVPQVRILRPGDAPPVGSSTVSIHGAEREADAGILAVPGLRSLTSNDFSFLQSVANVISASIARNQIEEQLRLAERETVEQRGKTVQAQEALNQRDEFISVAAHELRTPLTALQLKLQSLQRTVDAERRKERLGGAVRQTERLSRLIDRLLDVSRIAQGRVEMAPESFDLSALVRQVADDFREPAIEANSPLEVRVPETLEGSWDRLRLEQVLVNLLSNAVKYGAGKPITVSLEAQGDKVRLTVADHGIGIAAEDLKRIFGRFQRAAPIRNYGGLGLGLYITQYIVEAHRGSITVDSKLDRGSTFLVELPRSFVPADGGQDRVARAHA
jgi:PAS domain S-box-containing protein